MTAGSDGVVRPGGLRLPASLRAYAAAWTVLLALAIGTAVAYVAVVVPGPELGPDQLYWWPLVAALMWAAEAAAVRIGVGGRLVLVPIVVVPTVIAYYHLNAEELVLARLTAAAVAIAVGRHRSPLRTAITLVGVAASSSVGALVFAEAAAARSPGIVGLLIVSYAGAASMVASGTLVDAVFTVLTRTNIAVGGFWRSLLVGLVTSLLGTSFAVVAVVFLDSQPGELWALAAPTIVGLLGYRSFSLQRGREARLRFLHDCAEILAGGELDDVILSRLGARTRAAFRVATVEVLLATGPEPGTVRRTLVDVDDALRTDVVDQAESRARQALLGHDGASRPLGGDELGSAGTIDERRGMIVAVRGATGILGTLLVADRLDDLDPFDTEDIWALQALGSRLGLSAENTGLVGQLAASAGNVRKLAAIVQSSEDAIVAIDTTGRISAWNPAATRLFGYGADEMISRVASDVVPEAERARVRDAFAAGLAGASVGNLRMAWLRRDGRAVPISITISPIRGERDEVTGVSAIVRDETDRLRAEAAIAASAEQLRIVIDGSPLGMGTAGRDHRWIQANPALGALFGLTGAETTRRSILEMIHPDDRSTVDALEGQLFLGDAAVRSVERRYVSRAGRVVWTQVTARLLLSGPSGEPIALYTLEDITERRHTEERTRSMEERFRRAALAISSVQEPSRVIAALLESARDTLGAEYAAVVTSSRDGPEILAIEASGGAEPAALEADLVRRIGETNVPPLMRSLGRPLRLQDLPAGDESPGAGSDASRARSLLAVPLAHDLPGTATLYLVNSVEAFDEGDEAVAVALATHAAVCLENARVNARARELVSELDRANGELSEANAAKTRFVAAMAHELRTPLHAIVVAADLVNDPLAEALTAQQVHAFGRTVESSGRHMVRLIDDLSDLARIESGRMEIRLAKVPLADILGEVRASLTAAADVRGITMVLPTGPIPEVVVDPARLRQILTNLVGNAIKFSERGGTVAVDVRRGRSAIRITVRDTGIGIREEDLERAFLPFEQVSRTSSQGAGLGLAISRSLAELHGGTLEATSRLGAGSAFTLVLPRRPRPLMPHPSALPAMPARHPVDGAGRPILVVEDDSTTLALATDILGTVGYEVWAASGLEEAGRRLDRGVPALIVLDLRLGDGHGLDLVARVRSDPATAAVPILVVSADTAPEDVRRAREAGCDDVLPKPIRPRLLLARIHELTQGREGAGAAER